MSKWDIVRKYVPTEIVDKLIYFYMDNKYYMEKKKYIKPECKVIKFNFKTSLLSSSSDIPDDRNECENPWWCDNQPSPDDWWGN